ncbi:unnamed protein product [Moneuplotes crassus]|uniref:Uncharacterized protein n=1 Tax=Euplotes crassus TaxID=5936 RepID=A0AAD1XSH8_EUPCR|nr:unnamed protein product [Moneuplotes crassus]
MCTSISRSKAIPNFLLLMKAFTIQYKYSSFRSYFSISYTTKTNHWP